MIKHLLMDLDNTILDFSKHEHIALTGALTSLGIEPTPDFLARYAEINRSYWIRFETDELTRQQVLLGRFADVFAEYHIDIPPDIAQEAYESRLSSGHYFLPGAPELLDALYGKYHLYLATNGNKRTQVGRLASSQIGRYFDGIFISEDMGANKPSLAYFNELFDKIGNPDKDECAIFGDGLTSDMRGGIRAGIHTVWFNPEGREPRPDIIPEYQIRELSALPALLASIQ